MTNADGQIVVAPRQLIVPSEAPCPNISGAGVVGSLNMSGAKLFVYCGTGWQLVTST
jgi:hypothetical protein